MHPFIAFIPAQAGAVHIMLTLSTWRTVVHFIKRLTKTDVMGASDNRRGMFIIISKYISTNVHYVQSNTNTGTEIISCGACTGLMSECYCVMLCVCL